MPNRNLSPFVLTGYLLLWNNAGYRLTTALRKKRAYYRDVLLCPKMIIITNKRFKIDQAAMKYWRDGEMWKKYSQLVLLCIAFSQAEANPKNAMFRTDGADKSECAKHIVSEKYEDALSSCTSEAKKGDAQAQYNLAYMYLQGVAVSQDKNASFTWIKKSAESGFVPAYAALAECYRRGTGTSVSNELSVQWDEKAARAGDSQGQFNLGYYYEHGHLKELDYKQALHWYRKAADQGNADAYTNIGSMYMYGRGLEKSSARAFEYFEKGANLGSARGQRNLANMYFNGVGVTQNVSTAAEWYGRSADAGDPVARFTLGYLYEMGQGVKKDIHKAVALYEAAARQDHTDAQWTVGQIYVYGRGVDKDVQKGMQWLLRSVESGSPVGAYFLAVAYADGVEIARDFSRAHVLANFAILRGNNRGEEVLSYIKNNVTGKEWENLQVNTREEFKKQGILR